MIKLKKKETLVVLGNFKSSHIGSIFLLTLCVFMVNCGVDNPSLKNVVENRFKECDSKKICQIDLKESMNFEWDNFYCFDEGVTSNAVSKALGFEYLESKDLSRLIVFTKGKKIVYQEKENVNYQRPYKIDFYGKGYHYTPSNARFNIQRDEERDSYVLTHVDN